mgnify:CR=1 FL=1
MGASVEKLALTATGAIGEEEKSLEEQERELASLYGTWQYIQALKQRNRAQLDSFVSAEAQWETQSQEDRDYLESLPAVEARIDLIAQQLKSKRG